MANRPVTHEGYVDSDVVGGRLKVRILSLAACVGCAGEHHCTSNEMQEKFIDAITDEPLKHGDPVVVSMAPKLGTIAVIYLFIIPSIIVVATLIAVSIRFNNEIAAGLSSLGSLGAWYGILFLFRDHISKDFVFKATYNHKGQE